METPQQQLTLAQRFHRSEGGAVALLMLAGALILLLVAFALYDTGTAAQDKMAVQVSADSAAYSHSVIKARSMNVIVFANIIKRMYYSYISTYTNAWAAIFWAEANAISTCNPYPATWCHCAEAVEMGIFILIEGAEALVTNEPTLGFFYGNEYVPMEINGLERYQQYMHSITPWWAYVEGYSRAAINGGMISAQWPPPPTSIDNIKAAVGTILNTVNAVGAILGMSPITLPGFSRNVDTLPIARRDRMVAWQSKTDPYQFTIEEGQAFAGLRYCTAYIGSFEHIIHGVQTYRNGDEGVFKCPSWRGRFMLLDIAPAVGCLVAHLRLADDGYLDWRIHAEKSDDDENKESWAQSTSTVALAYRPRAGRNESEGGRSKFDIMSKEHNRDARYTNEGYWAFSRSEIVYKQPFNSFSGLGNALGGFGTLGNILGSRTGVNQAPDMWSPRWKARNRPFALEGETVGSAIEGSSAGMNVMVNDMVPLLLLGATIGIFDDNFALGSAFNDLRYLLRVDSGFTTSRMDGMGK